MSCSPVCTECYGCSPVTQLCRGRGFWGLAAEHVLVEEPAFFRANVRPGGLPGHRGNLP